MSENTVDAITVAAAIALAMFMNWRAPELAAFRPPVIRALRMGGWFGAILLMVQIIRFGAGQQLVLAGAHVVALAVWGGMLGTLRQIAKQHSEAENRGAPGSGNGQ